MAPTAKRAPRAHGNGNQRGSSSDRRARRRWLLEVYASDVEGHCRCYRCGTLLNMYTITVDRIIPGVHGGTYRRNNIRPACYPCNNLTGQPLRGTAP